MTHPRQAPSGPNPPPPGLARRAQQVGEPENFFVGLPDGRLPPPRNILMFCNERLVAQPKNASHHRHMLILNMGTRASLLLDSLLLELAPGQALLVFPFQSHRYLEQEAPRSTWLFITFDMPENEVLADLRDRPVDVPAELWPLADDLLAEYQAAHQEHEPPDAVPALLVVLLLRLLRQVRRQPAARWDLRPSLPSHRLVQRACRHIHERLGRPFTVAALAADLHVSGGYLRACFQQVIGLRVTTYIRRARLHAACALLSRTEHNITDIAEKCGFGSVYAFSRAFHHEIGMAPTRYRTHLWEQRNVGRPPAAGH